MCQYGEVFIWVFIQARKRLLSWIAMHACQIRGQGTVVYFIKMKLPADTLCVLTSHQNSFHSIFLGTSSP